MNCSFFPSNPIGIALARRYCPMNQIPVSKAIGRPNLRMFLTYFVFHVSLIEILLFLVIK